MPSTMLNTVFLSSFLATTYAFIPVQHPPVPSDLDTNQWVPYTTLQPLTSISTPTATPSSADAALRILPVLDANFIPELKRQVTGQSAAAAATAIDQVSPITTYYANSVVDGSTVQVPVVYTQTFPTSYEQWSSPTAGSIGLGTIQGTIGVVKTKRSLPTQAPLAESIEKATPLDWEIVSKPLDGAEEQEGGFLHPLLNKLKKAGKEIHDEFGTLFNKQKKKPAGEEPEQLEKEMSLNPSSPVASKGQSLDDGSPLENEQKTAGTAASDARILRAGTLTVFAVGFGTICVGYL